MTENTLHGNCLCEGVSYKITGHIGIFQYCHCSRCRKFTGSAFASNLFVNLEQFEWTKGEDYVGRFEPADTKYFATCFCKKCGSSLPWKAQGGKVIVIPAGTLNDAPDIRPSQNIFCDSKAPWFEEPESLKSYEKLPPKK